MTKSKVVKMLNKFNLSNDLINIEAYYNTPSFLELTGKERLEEVHSNILSWFFREQEIKKFEAIKRFLNLVIYWAEKEDILIDEDFKKAVYSSRISIDNNYEVIREEPIFTSSYGNGKIDIVLKCNCKYLGFERKLNIIIENKVKANETKKKGKAQTQAYYDYYYQNYSNDINIFVYLKPETTFKLNQQIVTKKLKEWRACSSFIVINYQELLSKIIEPIREIKIINERTSFILGEYIKSLGKTNKYNYWCPIKK